MAAAAWGERLPRFRVYLFAFLICGAAYFVATMAPAVDPHWRDMDRRPVASSREGTPDPPLVHS